MQDSSAVAQEGQKVAESILSFFPGFQAFTLPSPTVDPEKMKSINDNEGDINPLFFSGLEEFKRMLWNVLVPKNSFNNGEVVTGEGECGRFHELQLLMVPTAHLHILLMLHQPCLILSDWATLQIKIEWPSM